MDRYAFILLSIEKFWNRLYDRSREGKTVHVHACIIGTRRMPRMGTYITKEMVDQLV